jgi:tRNA nucleotidyltransferase (CCA-adding enzyme)
METRPAEALLADVHALPAAALLFDRLGDPRGVYLVGGAVRDLLRGGEPPDLDLVVEGDAAAVAARLGGRVVAHDRFGTSTVRLDGHTYDFARARTETYARPGALPEVAPASLAADLQRRDFTVNALAIALGGPHPGELSAVRGALEDLDAERLRVLHERSFIDDPTRLLRMSRYRARLGFSVEPHTRALAEQATASGALDTVSGARIGSELRLLCREPRALDAFAALCELGADRAMHPQFGIEDRELAERALDLARGEARVDRLLMALALRGVPGDAATALLDDWAFEAADRDAIVRAATRADTVAHALRGARRPSEIADAAAGTDPELVALAGALGPVEPARDWLRRLRHVRLQISGEDLIAAGIPEGRAIGAGLRDALRAKLDGRTSGPQDELSVALTAARDDGPGR